MPRDEIPLTFHLGVLAPVDYDPPGLERQLRHRLDTILARVERTHRVGFITMTGQPLAKLLIEYGRSHGWGVTSIPRDRTRGFTAVRRAWTSIAAISDGLLALGQSPELAQVVEYAKWLGLKVK